MSYTSRNPSGSRTRSGVTRHRPRLRRSIGCLPWSSSNGPALATGHIQFGCLNSFAKVTLAVLAQWCELLGRVPDSTLLLHCPSEAARSRVSQLFERGGVAPARVKFAGRMPLGEYFARHHEIDIALDPFPYSGGATTCDALWMGVPVVTLAGETAVSRGGLSILSNVGLEQLAASNSMQYVQIAADLAHDFSRLDGLRRSLRDRMQGSPLMDARAFARHLENAFGTMQRQE